MARTVLALYRIKLDEDEHHQSLAETRASQGYQHMGPEEARTTLRRATNVERAHCKLCSWLTNRLRRDHTNSLTDIYICPTSQITTVAFATDTSLRLTQ